MFDEDEYLTLGVGMCGNDCGCWLACVVTKVGVGRVVTIVVVGRVVTIVGVGRVVTIVDLANGRRTRWGTGVFCHGRGVS